ncbi:hypothetical protein ACFQ07_06015, partial [Actinomadura adrarensis]
MRPTERTETETGRGRPLRMETLEGFVLGDVLRTQARAHRKKPFLKFRDGEITYGEVDATADRMARGLAALG